MTTMQTFDEQKAFFEQHWPELRAAAEDGGAAAVIDHISGFEDPMQRRVLHVFVRQGLVHGDWDGKNLEVCIDVARGGIGECLRQAEAEQDPELRDRRIDAANVISYNLAVNLADCWPNDSTERTEAHFRVGLDAAERCIAWREQLDKPPGPRSTAWWAKGMHELSLGRTAAAAESFETSRDYAEEAAGGDLAAFGVVLAEGYTGIATWAAGGEGIYGAAVAAFRSQLADEEKKHDAQLGIDQLETVRRKYAR